ncbi:MAG TPA: mannitol-1-phosphate 5-dehydrogenase [Armatimonadota bacterium]|nr:mannitol-1-phosphate 5-dehydrogenase [Armatimonadota bacterium]
MRKFVQIGAGKIGRSFVAQLFSAAGYEVVFSEVNQAVIDALNERCGYSVEVRDRDPRVLTVRNARAIDARDTDAVAKELADCDCAATSVGPDYIRFTYPGIARALQIRAEAGAPPLDVILAENLRDAAAIVREGVRELLPEGFPVEDWLGLVETSIGKMVPIMDAEAEKSDPLLVYAEAYNNLICDARGFLNGVPAVAGLDAKQNIKAYVDRKSFIHNLGHALLAYFAHIEAPELVYTWEAIEHPRIGAATRAGMMESARALIVEYPSEFDDQNQAAHIDDLLSRFANKALGDTIYRVGRDVQRKLGPDDRVIGALVFDKEHGVSAPATTLCAAAGMLFKAADEAGEMFHKDEAFAEEIYPRGADHVLREICGLDPSSRLYADITQAHASVVDAIASNRSILDLI